MDLLQHLANFNTFTQVGPPKSVSKSPPAGETAAANSEVWSALSDFPEAGALLLALDHLGDQLFHIGVADRLDVPGLIGLAVALQRAALGELVELGAIDLDENALVLSEVLRDLRARELDPVELDVPPALQLQPEDEFQFLQRRNFGLEALDRGPDEVGRRGHPARSCASGGASCRSPCAVSRTCPRRSAAAARRGRGARSRTPSSSRSRRGSGTTPPRTPCRSPRRAASPFPPRGRSARPRPSYAPPCG